MTIIKISSKIPKKEPIAVKMSILRKILIFFCAAPFFIFSIDYEVKFFGLQDATAYEAINDISSLVSLKDHSPKTINALRFRANNDKINMIRVLHSFGYYDVEIKIDIQEIKEKATVYIYIYPNIRYLINDVKIYLDTQEEKQLDIKAITPSRLNLPLNSPLIAENVLRGENLLLILLSMHGYPLAKIEKRDIKIDLTKKTGSVKWVVNIGPLCKFGKTKISGVKGIEQSFFDNKPQWAYNQKYNSEKVVLTQQKLLNTNLFSSVAIVNDEKTDEKNHLDMNIKVVEAAHKYVTAGASYATIDGFGFSLGWGNRNFRSIGELLALEANVAQRMYLGQITFKKPDFRICGQDYVLSLQAERQNIPVVYLAFTYSLTNRIDTRFSKRLETSCGITAEYDEITHSANNGRYALLSLPVFLKFTTANNLLNPTKGYTFIYRAAPYKNFIYSSKAFFKQTLTCNFYMPIEQSKTLVLALRMQFGSIIGPDVHSIPLTKLFLGGSDDDLRGYKYRTVSPLSDTYDPIGGRSAIYFSFEPRIRISKQLGIVPFTDLGVVSFKKFPQIHEKWFKSIGIGLRYFSFFGPLRADIGFPLDRRSQIDPRYKIYLSIGQTF